MLFSGRHYLKTAFQARHLIIIQQLLDLQAANSSDKQEIKMNLAEEDSQKTECSQNSEMISYREDS